MRIFDLSFGRGEKGLNRMRFTLCAELTRRLLENDNQRSVYTPRGVYVLGDDVRGSVDKPCGVYASGRMSRPLAKLEVQENHIVELVYKPLG